MSENITELCLIQLRRALQQAALPAERQIASLKGFDVPFEVADDVYQHTRSVLERTDANLTEEQRSSLIALDALTDAMSDEHNAELWTDDALRSRPEWEEVRRDARKILKLFQWPVEDDEVPRDERIMLRQALRIAALPADQQIASFPQGSPVPEWIAGDFFNWSGVTLGRADFAPTDQQRFALNALDARLNEMCARQERDAELWTEEGLRRRPEWEEVRRQARGILEAFGWSIDE